CIAIGLKEIDNQDYREVLKSLVEKKWEGTTEENLFKKKDKVARYAIMKGFEPDLVWGIIKEIAP
ncbi:MAG TPA: RecX family transcriptional regulator, partial [Cytophagales bacterium]|nr:RecX family transcriptional regulator [Cytophagales bacterium]